MFSVGCLTRTMFFLDSCMDALAAVLLFFSILKLFIVLFFYSFLCVYQRNHRKYRESDPHSMNNSSEWRHSSSFDSSTENLPKKILISTPVTRPADIAQHDFVEKRRVILNDYDSQTPNKRVQGAAVLLPSSSSSSSPASSASPESSKSLTTTSHEHSALRKLSSISEKTERTETDESEPDLLRIKPPHTKRQVIITAAHQKRSPPPLPNKLPIIKNRRRIAREDENDNDSGTSQRSRVSFPSAGSKRGGIFAQGEKAKHLFVLMSTCQIHIVSIFLLWPGVERSSSEKSFGDHSISKQRAETPTKLDSTTKDKPVKVKSVPTLTFSNVFVTSVSQTDTKESSPDDDIKKLLIGSSSTSSSLSDHLLFTEVVTPKPILKKSPQQLSPASDHDRIPPSYHEQKKLSSLVSNKPYVKLTQPHGSNHSSKSYVPVNRKENLTPRPAPRPSLKHSSIDKQDESLVWIALVLFFSLVNRKFPNRHCIKLRSAFPLSIADSLLSVFVQPIGHFLPSCELDFEDVDPWSTEYSSLSNKYRREPFSGCLAALDRVSDTFAKCAIDYNDFDRRNGVSRLARNWNVHGTVRNRADISRRWTRD